MDYKLQEIAEHLHTYYKQKLDEIAANLAKMDYTWIFYIYQPNPVNAIKNMDLMRLDTLRDQHNAKMTFDKLETGEVVPMGIRNCVNLDAAMLRIVASSEHRMHDLLRSKNHKVQHYKPEYQPLIIPKTPEDLASEFAAIVEKFKSKIKTAERLLDTQFAELKSTVPGVLSRAWTFFQEHDIKFADNLADTALGRIRNTIANNREDISISSRLQMESAYLDQCGTLIVQRIIEYSFILTKQIECHSHCNIN